MVSLNVILLVFFLNFLQIASSATVFNGEDEWNKLQPTEQTPKNGTNSNDVNLEISTLDLDDFNDYSGIGLRTVEHKDVNQTRIMQCAYDCIFFANSKLELKDCEPVDFTRRFYSCFCKHDYAPEYKKCVSTEFDTDLEMGLLDKGRLFFAQERCTKATNKYCSDLNRYNDDVADPKCKYYPTLPCCDGKEVLCGEQGGYYRTQPCRNCRIPVERSPPVSEDYAKEQPSKKKKGNSQKKASKSKKKDA